MVKVSVVIPVYNVEDFLGECLDSIVNQTLDDIEIICVNDGSTDKSLDILNDYASRDDRFTVIDQENGGHAVATNRGMKLAKGKYLFLMDSDDILELTALEDTYKLAEEKNVDFVLFQAINYYMDTGEYVKAENYSMNALADYVGDKVFNYKDIEDYIFDIAVTPWTKLYNREFVERCGAIFPEGLVFEDNVFFWDVLFNAERIVFLRKHLFKRRWYSTSSTTSGGKHFVDSIAVNNLIIDRFMKYGMFEKNKAFLYNKKIRLVFMRYNKIKDEFKEYFYEMMKEDFTKMLNSERYDDFIQSIYLYNKHRFDSVVYSNNHEEFKILYENATLRNQNKNLERKIRKLSFENNAVLHSRSWEITSPLRVVKKIFK